MSGHNELETAFARAGLRLTLPRRDVFDALYTAKEPLMIKDIVRLCPNIDRVSIYRSLELFTQQGIAEIVPLGWKQRYELTSPFRSHHHHLYCTNCGKLIDVHSQKLELLVASITKHYGFTAKEHTFEISGTCSDCQTKIPA